MLRPIILKELLNLYRPQFKVFLYHFSQGRSCFLDFLFAKTTIIVLFYVGIFGFFPPVDGLIGIVFLKFVPEVDTDFGVVGPFIEWFVVEEHVAS